MFWIGLILGIIIGWIIEWILDWWFWRGDMSDVGTALSASSSVSGDLSTKLSTLQNELESQQRANATLKANISSLESSLSESNAVVKEVEVIREVEVIKEVPAANAPEAAVSMPDDLKKIKGIGKVYEGILNQGGITRFDQLAALNPENIQDVIGPENWQNIDPASWISQAKELAAQAKGDE